MSKHIAPPPLPHVAALYVRVSGKQQDEPDKTSLATQEQGERAWAAANGWLVDDRFVYRERHTGEELWERPALTQLRAAARERQFGVVVCHSIERLARNPIHMGILLDELARIGVTVEFVTEAVDDSPEGPLIRFIKSYAGQVENERRRERQMRATQARVDGGAPIATGLAPYGYMWGPERTQHRDGSWRLSKVRYVVNPLTAPILVRIFTDYARGVSLREIAAALTAEGIPTPKRRRVIWSSGTVRVLLRTSLYWGAPMTRKTRTEAVPRDQREFYTHKSVARGLPIEKQIALSPTIAPALVALDVAMECQRRLADNQRLLSNVPKDPESALLRGLARCGVCGGTIHANRQPTHRRVDGFVPSRYVCRNGIRAPLDPSVGRVCTPHALSCETLDAAVWAKVSAILRDPDLLRTEIEQMRVTEPPGTADLAALDGRLATLSRKIASLTETAGYARDPDTRRDLAGQIDVAMQQRRDLDAERITLAHKAANWEHDKCALEGICAQVEEITASAGTVIEQWTYAQKRRALLALKAIVTVYAPDHTPRAELRLSLPTGRLIGGGAYFLNFCAMAPVPK